MAEKRAELFEDLRGQGRGAADEQAHALADLARLVGRRVEQTHVHRGHAEKERGLEVQKLGKRGSVIEAFEQTHAAGCQQPAMQPVAERVHMKQRRREQKAIRRRDFPGLDQARAVHGEIVVREHGAFGDAGGSGRVDQRGGVVAIQRHFGKRIAGLRGRFRQQRGNLGGGHQQFGFGVAEDVRHLAIAIQNVDGDEDHAQLDAGEIEIDKLDAVRQVNAQAIAFGQAACGERARHAIAARVDFTESVD